MLVHRRVVHYSRRFGGFVERIYSALGVKVDEAGAMRTRRRELHRTQEKDDRRNWGRAKITGFCTIIKIEYQDLNGNHHCNMSK